MATVRHDVKQSLAEGVAHEVPVQTHRHTRGHQVHLDVTEHRDPTVTIAYDSEVSTDGGVTWSYGGGFTVEGGGPTVDKNGDPLRYAIANFGHEPHPEQPACPQRLVRGTVRVIPKPDETGRLTARTPRTVNTRVHVVGTATPHLDKSLIPAD